jgi:hypothetical protein
MDVFSEPFPRNGRLFLLHNYCFEQICPSIYELHCVYVRYYFYTENNKQSKNWIVLIFLYANLNAVNQKYPFLARGMVDFLVNVALQ